VQLQVLAAWYQWFEVTWKQAMSYCETACELLAFADEAVPGLPAYTVPAVPFGLNGEPLAVAELPGVDVASALPQVVPGAPWLTGAVRTGAGECGRRHADYEGDRAGQC
jgi:hypothetical protein